MNDALEPDLPVDPEDERPGFFGAERAHSEEPIDPEVWIEVDGFLAQNPGGAERLVPLLHQVQRRLGYLPFEVQEHLADRLGLSPVQVFGVVTFYHLFTTTPRARHQFKVCMGTACFVRRAQRLLDTLEEACGVEAGGISEDRLFNLDSVRCIGACGLAPAVMVDRDVHGHVSAAELREMVQWLRSGAGPKDGRPVAGSPEDPSP